MNEGVEFGDHATRPYDAPRKAKCKASTGAVPLLPNHKAAKPQGILEAQGTFFLRPCVRVL
jgi:hypothetical protein